MPLIRKKRYGFMLKKEDRVLNIGDRIIERGRSDVHVIVEILKEDKIYKCTRIIDDKSRSITFQNAGKTKRNPQLVIVATGFEFRDNIQTALKRAKIKYEIGYKERGRTDIAKFFVEEKEFVTAKTVIDDFYKNGEDLKPKEDVDFDDFTERGVDVDEDMLILTRARN